MYSEILTKHVTLRLATMQDAEMIFLWRNAPAAKKNSFTTHDIGWDEHQKWLSATLKGNNKILLIGEIEKQPFGVLRYNILQTDAEVSVYLDPNQYGKGLGYKLLESGTDWIRTNLTQIKTITASILDENISSQKVFVKAGYKALYHVYQYCIDQ